jgi:hypothetical protein
MIDMLQSVSRVCDDAKRDRRSRMKITIEDDAFGSGPKAVRMPKRSESSANAKAVLKRCKNESDAKEMRK